MSLVYVISDPTPQYVFRNKRKAMESFLNYCDDDGEFSNYNDQYDTAGRKVTLSGMLKNLDANGYVASIGQYQNVDISVMEVEK